MATKAAPWIVGAGAAYEFSQAKTNTWRAEAIASNGAAWVAGGAYAEAGAVAGAVLGPVGAVVGGILGGLVGGATAAAATDTLINEVTND